MSQLLSLVLRARVIALDAPVSMPFPMSIIMPAPPVAMEASVIDPFIVPPVSVPIMASVVSSPTRVYVKIKTWDTVIITPTPVIIG
jgi:energy-converting hydrogenase Eha subunit A